MTSFVSGPTVQDTQCSTVTDQVCSTETERVCNTVTEQQCVPTTEQVRAGITSDIFLKDKYLIFQILLEYKES